MRPTHVRPRLQSRRRRRRRARRRGSPLFLFVILAAQLMVVLDTTIVNVALPHIQQALGFSSSEPVVGAQRLHPRLRRIAPARRPGRRPLGRRRRVPRRHRAVHRQLAASADSRQRVDVPRGSSRAGRRRRTRRAAALSLLTTVFPEGPERIRAIGLYTTVSAAGGALGLVVGGLLTELGVVALGDVRQRADRRRHLGDRPPDHQRIRAPPRSLRPRRRGHLDRRHDPASSSASSSPRPAGWTSALTIGSLVAGVMLARDVRRHRAPGGGT